MIIKTIYFIEIAFLIFIGIALVYLVFKRIKDRDDETFEKRDN